MRGSRARGPFIGGDSLLERLVQNMPGGSINVLDREFRYLFAEGRGLAEVGLAPDMLVGRTLSDVFPRVAVDYVEPFYQRAFAGETVSFELPFGGRCYAVCTAPLEAGQSRVDSIIVVAQDITERGLAAVASREAHDELRLVNEELQVINEELQSTNEELRAANSALETSREESRLVNRQLTAANSDLKNLIYSTRLITLFLDRSLRIRRYTPSLRDLFNLIPDDVGRPVTDITHRLDYGGLLADCARVLGDLSCIEREVASTNGRWFIMRLQPFRAAKDTIDGVVITFVDITERKQIEEKLRQNESQLAEAQRLAHVGSWNWDLRTNVLMWSDELYRIFGIEPQSHDMAYDSVVATFVVPEDREMVRAVVKNSFDSGETFSFDYRIRRTDGALRIVHAHGSLTNDASGAAVRMFGAAQDVTEQRQVEERLRRQLDFTEAITAGLGEGVFALDPDGRVTFVNRAAEAMLGWTQPELLGRLLHEVVRLQRDDSAGWTADKSLPDEAGHGQASRARDYLFTRRDGSTFPVSLTVSPIVTGGRAVGTALAFHDVTEEERVKGMLQSFSKRLIEAQETERRRVARELHDEIGQALTAIKLNLQALPTSSCPAPQLRDSAEIVDRALRQVRELSLDLRPSQLDDLGLVVALRWHVDRESRRAGLNSEFVADLLPETRLPPELETACFRIAQEALTNVVRHARASRVRVDLRWRDSELHLRIRDDGIGFDLSAVKARRISDLSLGLRGMQERALIVGGRLEIDSSPSGGTEIYARIPLPTDASLGKGELG